MMNAQETDIMNAKYRIGEVLSEGKTKTIYAIKGHENLAILVAKNDLTAGNGAKHDVLPGKAILANETACNVFKLLARELVPVAFEVQDSNTSFVAFLCQMLPYEVVIRREAHGSYLKRNPESRGHIFPDLLLEFFLKTKDRKWKEHPLPCDDPLMIIDQSASVLRLYNPDLPMFGQEPFLVLPESEVFTFPDEREMFPLMSDIAKQAFAILETAWEKQGGRLVDFKVEFGISPGGRLLLADVIDADSWRVLDENDKPLSKQGYRDGADLDAVLATYQLVAELTSRF